MTKRTDIETILVIGSGPIVIGQAEEFDYAGTQACLALREEGYRVVLVNSNPATIMTDREVADKVYMEPLTPEFLTQVIAIERPDALLPSLGGQTGLNLAMELARDNTLTRYGVRVLGTGLESIELAEDRDLFKQLMERIDEPVAESLIVHDVDAALAFVDGIGYPVIVRPAFTLGGTGGGIADDALQLAEIVESGLKYSPVSQCLIEKSLAGFKEIEYEVMRDGNDNAIVVCNMENIDPVGIHTGDSVVVAPSQTLTDREYQLLRNSALKIIRALAIEGGCNVQFALDPQSRQYYVIEVNPRVSRSSALASKATGYPIAKLAAKIAVGLTLDQMKNPVTGTTYAGFEPALDYVVCKIPRFPFDKFQSANRRLGTQMKATGEVMAIGRNLEEALLKAVQSLEAGCLHLVDPDIAGLAVDELKRRLIEADDQRLYILADCLRRGMAVEQLHQWTKIDRFYLHKLANIIAMEVRLHRHRGDAESLAAAKRIGFSDWTVAELWQWPQEQVYQLRHTCGILPVYKMVDTCAAEFVSETPYFYSTYAQENESQSSQRKKVIVLGSGPIRIGQGVEFDYATVHSVQALREAGVEAIVINNNPETVSTDFSIADKLYFEPLTLEHVREIIDLEQPDGILVQFGGQTAIHLAKQLAEFEVPVLGTTIADLDSAEDREKFDAILEQLGILRPEGYTVFNYQEALQVVERIGYPALIRPSYVLGGRAMQIVYDAESLESYIKAAAAVDRNQPILIDKYIVGTEVEVDAVCDGETVVIPGIMEHIEKAGVHSGDSIAVYPPQTISVAVQQKIIEYTKQLALGFKIRGLLNIQFVIKDERVYVIEVNPRSSRTVPFLSKVTGIAMAKIATQVMLGRSLREMGYSDGIAAEPQGVYVKAPVFSFAKLRSVDIALGPEMKSTGEVIGKDKVYERALYKALVASNIQIPALGTAIFTIADDDKPEALGLARRLQKRGYTILATEGTAEYFASKGLRVQKIDKVGSTEATILNVIQSGAAQFVVNTLSKSAASRNDGFLIRRYAVENSIACFTSLDTVAAVVQVIETIGFDIEC